RRPPRAPPAAAPSCAEVRRRPQLLLLPRQRLRGNPTPLAIPAHAACHREEELCCERQTDDEGSASNPCQLPSSISSTLKLSRCKQEETNCCLLSKKASSTDISQIRRKLLGLVGEEGNAASVLGANFAAGFVAGSLAAGATCPLDVAKTRRQIEKDTEKAMRMTTPQTLTEIWRCEYICQLQMKKGHLTFLREKKMAW
ncbi:uncharacterized protein LOC120684847, partial [Panicum virgatum]|uniref:uncharacterized protein LOC120684847 n=1 Tax=Panicum virgatum TaxID=38727 RepID=UPI0019D6153C